VASKTDQEIRDLLAAIGVSMQAAERLPDAVQLAALRAQIQQLRNDLPVDVGGSTAGSWSQLPSTDQDALAERLQQAADGADAAAALVDCNQPDSLMSRKCAGNLEIGALLVLTVLGLVLTLREIHYLWPRAHGATGPELQVDLDLAKQQYSDARVAAQAAETAVADLQRNQAAAAVIKGATKNTVKESPQATEMPAHDGSAPPAKNTIKESPQATEVPAHDGSAPPAKNPIKESPQATEVPAHDGSAPPDSSTAARASDTDEQRLALAKVKMGVSQNVEKVALVAVETAHDKLVPRSENILKMVILMGTLGGLIHLATSLSMYVGNRALRRSWIMYYVLMPLQGAALAPIVYLLLTAAVLAPSAGAEAGATHEPINVTSVYAFSALTGLFAKQALEKLADVFATIFTSVKGKDSLQ
jgi:hypothetical protein